MTKRPVTAVRRFARPMNRFPLSGSRHGLAKDRRRNAIKNLRRQSQFAGADAGAGRTLSRIICLEGS